MITSRLCPQFNTTIFVPTQDCRFNGTGWVVKDNDRDIVSYKGDPSFFFLLYLSQIIEHHSTLALYEGMMHVRCAYIVVPNLAKHSMTALIRV